MKIITLAMLLAIGTTAFAQTGRKAEKKVMPATAPHAIFSPATVTSAPNDTLWGNFPLGSNASTGTATPTIYTDAASGNCYMTGNDTYSDQASVQAFTVSGSMTVYGGIFWFAGKVAGGSTGDTASHVTANVYAMDGTGTSTAGSGQVAPGTVQASMNIKWDNIDTSSTGANGMVLVNFSSPVVETSDFGMGINFSGLSAGDSTGLICSDTASVTSESSWQQWSDNSWWTFAEAPDNWGTKLDLAVFPIVDNGAGIQNYFFNGIKLYQNTPNPFAGKSVINYELANNTKSVKLMILDMTGRLVKTLDEGAQKAGKHTVTLNATDFASGTYFFALQADTHRIAKKMVIVQ